MQKIPDPSLKVGPWNSLLWENGVIHSAVCIKQLENWSGIGICPVNQSCVFRGIWFALASAQSLLVIKQVGFNYPQWSFIKPSGGVWSAYTGNFPQTSRFSRCRRTAAVCPLFSQRRSAIPVLDI